jgi:hypothetical protein
MRLPGKYLFIRRELERNFRSLVLQISAVRREKAGGKRRMST